MGQDDQSQKCSNSSSGGVCGNRSSNKKMKQKKVPQRGLGVAQLEKIRLEEQHKKANSIMSTTNSSSCLAVQCPNPSIPLPPPPPPPLSDRSSSVSMFRPLPNLIPNMDVVHPNEIGWPKFLNCEYNQDRLDHHNHGFAPRSNLNLPSEFWPIPNVVMNRPEQFQQPSPSAMVNVSTGTSSSSVINYQMEPPSNQSYYGNNYTTMWPEEGKVVGMKRSYPFPLENPPVPTFHCKFPPTYVAPITRSDESASCGNGGTVNIEPQDFVFREGPSSSSGMSEPNSKKAIENNGGLNGDFLTLAPPTTTLPQMVPNHKHTLAYLASNCHEPPKFESLPYQGSVEEQVHWQGPSGPTQQQLLYSFFATPKTQIGQPKTTMSNYSGEVGESVDLNLKL